MIDGLIDRPAGWDSLTDVQKSTEFTVGSFWLVACGPAGGLNFQAGRITHKSSVQALRLQHMQL